MKTKQGETMELCRMKVPEFVFDIDRLVFSGEYKYSNVSLEAVEKLASEIGYKLIRSK